MNDLTIRWLAEFSKTFISLSARSCSYMAMHNETASQTAGQSSDRCFKHLHTGRMVCDGTPRLWTAQNSERSTLCLRRNKYEHMLRQQNQNITSTGSARGLPCTWSSTSYIHLPSSVIFILIHRSSHPFVDLRDDHFLSCFPIMQTRIYFLHPSYLSVLHFTTPRNLNLPR
jgi:hypothetical protein